MQVDSRPDTGTTIIDGIVCHALSGSAQDNPDYPTEGLANLAAAEDRHFWFKTRRQLICSTVARFLPRKSRFLEVGAGTGYVAKGLQSAGYDVAVGEYYMSGLRFARAKGINECHQLDIFNPPFSNAFDAIGLFDVIEHFEEDDLALANCRKMLKDGGYLFATVPAHAWLWNREDQIAGHKRRYNKKQLQAVALSAGLELIDVRYFFVSILPLLILRSLISPDHRGHVTPAERMREIKITPINSILEWLTNWENRFQKMIPNLTGGSLMLVARKSGG